ncbi:MAG: hypothetical protein AB1428_08835 [Bacteroidota bacterium]
MKKFFRSGYAFLLVALLFLVVAAGSERPAVYIALGVVFLILAVGVRRRNAEKDKNSPSGE